MPGPDRDAVAAVRARDAALTKPAGALGRLEEIAEWLAAWQGRAPPAVNRPLVAVFAGNHGVVARGVSAYPPAVTAADGREFRGRRRRDQPDLPRLRSRPQGLRPRARSPTGDITVEAALDEAACAATMAFGMEATAGGIDLLCIGEMGIGNTTVAAAVFAGLFGGPRRGDRVRERHPEVSGTSAR